MLGSFLLESDSHIIKIVANWRITNNSYCKLIETLKQELIEIVFLKRLIFETLLVSWKTAIEEAPMYTLDGIDTQFTLKCTGSDIVK